MMNYCYCKFHVPDVYVCQGMSFIVCLFMVCTVVCLIVFGVGLVEFEWETKVVKMNNL